MNILKRRNFKYSAASTAFTAAVIVVVMLVNAAFSLLAARYSLFVDLTDSELWTLSDAAKKVIGDADGEITITFCHDPDYIDSSTSMGFIHRTALEIEKEFDNIHVRYVNSKLDPQLLKPYLYNEADTISATSVIMNINCQIGPEGITFGDLLQESIFLVFCSAHQHHNIMSC